MPVHIRLLGAFEVTVDGRLIDAQSWRRRAAADLVKLLALQLNGRLRREQVIDALWPDLLVDEAAPKLHSAAHYARSALGSGQSVVLTGGTVALLPDVETTVDVDEFERAAEVARSEGGAEAARAATALYAGELLPDDLYLPWTEEPRERLRLRHLELLRAAGQLEDLVRADPLDEAARLALVREHVRAGRRREALLALDRMDEDFRRELGVQPGDAATKLREAAEGLPVEVLERDAAGPDSFRARIPAARSRLIGREVDLKVVGSLLRTNRVVTITGPGGAGKSTLALELARGFQPGESGVEVILAELAPVRDESGVTRAVAEAAGIQGAGADEVAALAAILGPRSVLLVLDNCEHLLDASAALVDAILDAGAQATILVTSREPLRVDGEAVHRIGSLGRESAELFVERAVAAAGPGAASVDDPRVVDLCDRLDGLPLAIELAAAQLRHLSLTELVDRLDDRLALLSGGRPKAGERHSALAATIQWSYRLLSEEARDLFDRLGVFPASFDLEAVQAVAGGSDPAEAINLLGDLVAKSLVVHEADRRRYRLLETIRLYAAQQLEESGRTTAVTQLLRAHVVARARALPRVRSWLSASLAARSRDDLDNVRLAYDACIDCGDLTAAVDIALGVSTLWRNAVSYAEGRRWVAALHAGDLTEEDRLWTSILEADIGVGSGEPSVMRRASKEAREAAGRLSDPDASVIAAVYSAMTHLAPPDRAAARLHEASAQARALGEPGLERLARGYRVVALRMAGNRDEADAEARELTESDSERDYGRYICIWAASMVALVDRDGARLRGLMDAQLSDLKATGLHENWLTMYWEALAMAACGEDCIAQLRSARRRAEDEGRRADADCVLALGFVAACADDWEGAAEMLGAVEGALLHDTAGFLHHTLLREELVRPRLEPGAFARATTRGTEFDIAEVLREHGL
jgi:predicted ATPase/DNA-binding SARP family transcriptional activator